MSVILWQYQWLAKIDGKTILSYVWRGVEFIVSVAPMFFLLFVFPLLLLGTFCVLHFFATLPVRRAERSRFLLTILEHGNKRGKSVVETIRSLLDTSYRINITRPGPLGKILDAIENFWYRWSICLSIEKLSQQIDAGHDLAQAFRRVPKLLPAPVAGMLDIGEKTGTTAQLFPVCRAFLSEIVQTKTTLFRQLMRFSLCFFPLALAFGGWEQLIIPQFRRIAADFKIKPPFFVTNSINFFSFAESFILFGTSLFILTMIFYLSSTLTAKAWFIPLYDRFNMFIPWRRKHLQRNFAVVFAALLDSGIPEVEAIRMAAESTANGVMQRRARKAMRKLEKGESLRNAIAYLDANNELRWYLDNACQTQAGFYQALQGWHKSLAIKARQQKQIAGHIILSVIVIINSVLVGCVVIGIFGFLIQILESHLW